MTGATVRGGLLGLTVDFNAGVHAALIPEHLREMPPLGYLFIFAAAVGAGIAVALVARPHDAWISRLAVLFSSDRDRRPGAVHRLAHPRVHRNPRAYRADRGRE
jgi:hypothetical protein